METNVPYIEIAPFENEEEEGATYDTGSKGNTQLQCMSKLKSKSKILVNLQIGYLYQIQNVLKLK